MADFIGGGGDGAGVIFEGGTVDVGVAFWGALVVMGCVRMGRRSREVVGRAGPWWRAGGERRCVWRVPRNAVERAGRMVDCIFGELVAWRMFVRGRRERGEYKERGCGMERLEG